MISDRSESRIVSRLELPSMFFTEHGEKMRQDAELVRPVGCGEWLLRFEAHHSPNMLSRVFAVGGGWRDFVLDNGISVGEFLVFELVHSSRLVVHVYPRDGQVDEESPELSNPGPVNASHKVEHNGFKKTLSASHGLPKKRTRLDIPASFCRSHGMEKFDKKVYTLEGPRMKGEVKAYMRRTSVQIRCVFRTGWHAFYEANKLKIGDTVVFTLTGKYQFVVSVEAP